MHFIERICYYFAYPQRKAALRRVQEENNLPVKFPKQIAPTRWLSLGKCLTRVVNIWQSLVKYFKNTRIKELPKIIRGKTKPQSMEILEKKYLQEKFTIC